MSNLGWYQIITSASKKVGGPKNLIGLLIGGGALLGGGTVLGGSVIKKKISSDLEKKKQSEDTAIIYNIKKNHNSTKGVVFKKGDKFRILEVDGDVGLIEIIGDNNSPYYFSLKLLASISDYNIHK